MLIHLMIKALTANSYIKPQSVDILNQKPINDPAIPLQVSGNIKSMTTLQDRRQTNSTCTCSISLM